jgi:hypothetical protein
MCRTCATLHTCAIPSVTIQQHKGRARVCVCVCVCVCVGGGGGAGSSLQGSRADELHHEEDMLRRLIDLQKADLRHREPGGGVRVHGGGVVVVVMVVVVCEAQVRWWGWWGERVNCEQERIEVDSCTNNVTVVQ